MESDRFDALTKRLGGTVSRRGALAALAGAAGLAGLAGGEAAKDKKRRQRQNGAAGKRRAKQPRRPPAGDAVAAEATCANPGPSSNLNNCNFNDAEFAGIDLSSSSMKGTKFRRADLCRADLSSSNLRNAEFQNANLTKADLSSSACNGANFNGATFCGTKTCNGSIRNDACPGADPDDVCCSDEDCPDCTVCGGNGQCAPCPGCCDADGGCQPGNVATACGAGGETCENCPAPVGGDAVCGDDGDCATTCPAGNPTLCGTNPGTCLACCADGTGCANTPGCGCRLTATGPRDCGNNNTCHCIPDCADCPSATHVCLPLGSIGGSSCTGLHPCCERCRAT